MDNRINQNLFILLKIGDKDWVSIPKEINRMEQLKTIMTREDFERHQRGSGA